MVDPELGEMEITGTTRLVGVFGYPVKHSLSPPMHNAAFRALGLDWCYVPFEVEPQRLAEATRGVAALGMVGVNVTIPHKEAMASLIDELRGDAQALGAVNTVHCDGGRLIGYNTDGDGFLGSLASIGFDPAGKVAAVLGAGGASRAVCLALAHAGAGEIRVANRTSRRSEELTRLVSQVAERGSIITTVAWGRDGIGQALRGADLLVNATSVGMWPDQEKMPPVRQEDLRAELVVCDLVYRPLETSLLRQAAGRGCLTLGGAKMLALQGAVSFRIWTGVEPPVEVMEQALLEGLAAGS